MINKELAEKKGLIKNNDSSLYEIIRKAYRQVLDNYILNNTSIKKYNEKIKNSNLDFNEMPNDKKHLNHKNSNLNLEFIFIRNDLFVEKLSIEVINYIIDKINKKELLEDKMTKIIEKSYKEVIKDNYQRGKYMDNSTTCYGAVIPDNIVPSDNLVIIIQYGKNKENLSKEQFNANFIQKQEFLENLKKEMEIEISKELNIPVKVLIRNFVGEN